MCRRSVSLSVRADFKVSSAFGREEAMRWLERVAQGQLAVNLPAIDRDQDGQGRPSLSDGQSAEVSHAFLRMGLLSELPTALRRLAKQLERTNRHALPRSRHRDVALHCRELCQAGLSRQELPQVAAAQDHQCKGQRPLILPHRPSWQAGQAHAIMVGGTREEDSS